MSPYEAEVDLTMSTLQNIKMLAELMAGLEEAKAQLNVPKMMIASSMPYMRRRPRVLRVRC